MSDDLGTNAVTEISDPGTLQSLLAEKEAEIASLKSNLGRQNDVQGRRLKELKDEMEAFKEEARRRDQEQMARQLEARKASLSPAERAQFEARQAQEMVRSLLQEKEQERTRAQEKQLLDEVIGQAVKVGMPRDEIDTSSYDQALLSFKTWSDGALMRKLQELEDWKKQQEQDLAETVRVKTGGRQVVTGSVPTRVAKDTYPPEVADLVKDLQAELNKKQPSATRVLFLKREAASRGYNLSTGRV
jgi:hypothetical protein